MEDKDLDRRGFMRKAGVTTAVAGAVWVAPSITGSSVAFAAGSTDPVDPVDPVDPPEPKTPRFELRYDDKCVTYLVMIGFDRETEYVVDVLVDGENGEQFIVTTDENGNAEIKTEWTDGTKFDARVGTRDGGVTLEATVSCRPRP